MPTTVDLGPGQLAEDVARTWTLQLQRCDLELANLDIEGCVECDRVHPEQRVGAADREPDRALIDHEQHGIADHDAALITQEGIGASPGLVPSEVACDEVVRERERVAAFELELALRGGVPERNALGHGPVLLRGTLRVGVRDEGIEVQPVVAAARPIDTFEIGRHAADPALYTRAGQTGRATVHAMSLRLTGDRYVRTARPRNSIGPLPADPRSPRHLSRRR
jgi:hypothetical protein